MGPSFRQVPAVFQLAGTMGARERARPALRRAIMESFAATGTPGEHGDVRALAEQHVVVLDDDGRILMAHPFAAHHDGARVDAQGRTWWGNCAWDGVRDRRRARPEGRDDHRPGHHARRRRRPRRGLPRARPRPPLVGRHRLHLSDDAAPPVGSEVTEGELVDLPTLRTLAQRWYGDRLSPDWRPRSARGVAGDPRLGRPDRRLLAPPSVDDVGDGHALDVAVGEAEVGDARARR